MKTVARYILAGTFFTVTGVPAQTQPAQRYSLNAEAVVQALHVDGFDVQPDQVRMPVLVSATVESPALELFGADRLPDGHVRMRLRCHKAGECIPFSVIISRPEALLVLPRRNAVLVEAESRTDFRGQIAKASVSTTASSGTPALNQSLAPPPPLSAAFVAPTVPAFFAAGAKLTMLMEDGHMHIHLPVIAVDSSAAGSEVRVCTPDRKHTFHATVVDSNTVRGIVE